MKNDDTLQGFYFARAFMQFAFSNRYWIKKFPLHFDVDDRLHDIMETFTIQLEAEGYLEWSQWLDLSNIPSYDWLRNHSVKESEASRPYRKVSLIFNHLEPDELAHHVTYLEHKIMRRITVRFLEKA